MELIITLFNILTRLVYLYTTILIVYALMSWFPGAYQSRFGQLLSRICEPFLDLPLQFGGIDFSVMAAIFALNFAMRILQRILINLMF